MSALSLTGNLNYTRAKGKTSESPIWCPSNSVVMRNSFVSFFLPPLPHMMQFLVVNTENLVHSENWTCPHISDSVSKKVVLCTGGRNMQKV